VFERPVLVVFHGGTGSGQAERMLAAARIAAARNTARSALAAGFVAVIVATDDPAAFSPEFPGLLIDADRPGDAFDFAARLRGIVSRFGLQRPATMGSGSVPLLGVDEFRLVVEQLEARDPRFVTNNFFSADLTAWTPGDAIERCGEFARDNVLPAAPRRRRSLDLTLPRTTATQFDLDTPSDLAVSLPSRSRRNSPRRAASRPAARRYHFMPLLRPTRQVVIARRVGGQAWQYLERETACRVRLFAEERGLATAPPGYQARSILGFLIEEVGPERFFQRMAELGDGAVIDTRVIEAHMGVEPSREDRFQSDLLAWEAIQEPFLRRFTKAAAEAPIPVLLGGHSLVSGGLMALNDIAWAENDRRLGI
jgi:hypothetical protein